MGKIIHWHFTDVVRMIVATLLNKYDCFMTIEGLVGVGKSTLAYQIAWKVACEFRKLYKLDIEAIEYYYERVGRKLKLTEEEFVDKIMELKKNKAYIFNPRHSIIYTQDAMQKALASWNCICIPDEMINITFNRDFYSEKQKDIIKLLNIMRDHCNLIVACVPQFQNLDTQIKNLCKLKITVKRRGTAIIHTPNSVIYCKDKWDSATNEKIEREWIMKKVQHPNYSKLTTFRGLLRFPQLSKKAEAKYQQIKNEKRSLILRDDMKVELTGEETPLNKFVKRLIEGGIRNGHTVDGYAEGMGITPDQLRSRTATELKKMGKASSLSYYFWDKSKKSMHESDEKKKAIDNLI